MAANAVIVLRPGEGRVVPRRYGEQTILKATEDETRGAYAVRENLAPEGFGGVPLHVHREAEEAFYILEGELTIFSEDRALAAPAGSFVLIPRGTVHSIANLGEGPCRWVTMISPAWGVGLDRGGARQPGGSGGNLRPLWPGDHRSTANPAMRLAQARAAAHTSVACFSAPATVPGASVRGVGRRRPAIA
jgi:mannose-6-phosphate isomerase-like protein (cupin superfamily)